jgi:hypothetical protein
MILNLIHKFINFLKKITPHPNPLSTSGERALLPLQIIKNLGKAL